MTDITKEMLDAGEAAIDALEYASMPADLIHREIARAAISAALSRPIDPKAEVEPVAWMDEFGELYTAGSKPYINPQPLYSHPYQLSVHPDDEAVDRFAAAMKAKLAKKRSEGRGGWEGPTCSDEILSRLLREHVEKGDPLDVGNLAMMLHQRGERIK